MGTMLEAVNETSGDMASPAAPMEVVLCIDHDALARLRAVIRHLCVGLVDLNVKLRVVSPSEEAAPLAALGPIQVVRHDPLGWPRTRARMRRVREQISDRRPSVIYAVSSGSFGLGGYLADECGAGLCVGITAWRDIDALETLRAGQSALRVVAGEPLMKRLREREGADVARQHLIRPGVQRGTETTCFDEPDRVPSIVCTSRLETRFGVHVVIDAVERLRDRGHQVLFFFTGAGCDEDALRRRVNEKRLNAEVTFARATAEPADILRGADVLIVPPGDDDISARPLQAMANGTVVVCFAGGCADYFHQGETAVVCDDRTPAALALGIESLLTDHDYACRLAQSARNYVLRHHTMSAMSALTRDALLRAGAEDSVVAAPGGRGPA
ncbi:MAG: glycosyltransferase family 4 protein [Phycisphaerales bacterium]|nr:glycosyltransferase family 4 protein [Phycisphaerales bacterium]